MATKAKAAQKPLAQLRGLLPKITHEELLELIAVAQVEAGRRATAYADAALEDDTPRDVVTEGLAYVTRLLDLLPKFGRRASVSYPAIDAADVLKGRSTVADTDDP